jgi:uncharacterized protein YgiM (DUF1202 family)
MKRLLCITLLTVLVLTSVLTAALVFAQGGGYPINQGVVAKNEGELGIYAEADINSALVGTVPNGETVDIFSISGLFAQVTYGDLSGWALVSDLEVGPAHVNLQGTADTRSDFAIRETADLQANIVATLPSGSLLGVLLIDDRWAYVYDGQHLGWAFVSDLALSEPTADLADLVQSQAVTRSPGDTAIAVRAEPNVSADAVTTLEAGTAVSVAAYDDTGRFAYIVTEAGNGWAFVANLTITPRGLARATVARGPANLREEAARDSGQITLLAFDTPLLLLSRNEDSSWLYVRVMAPYFIGGEETSGFEGWISASLIDAGEFDLSTLPVEG